jgi:HK97 family phage major capsid protein
MPAAKRKSQPGTPAGSMPGEFNSTARMTEGERLIDSRGNELRVFGKGERIADSIPRAERLAPGDLGAIVLGAASGDWSKVSDRCRQVMAQMGTVPDSSGGYLLPAPLSAEIISKMYDKSVFAQTGHRTVLMATKTLQYARVVSSVSPNWRIEHQVIRETTPVLDSVQLTAKNLGAMTRSSVELLEDAPVASTLLRDLLAEELAQEYDRAMFDGAGGIEPTGLLQAAGVQSIFWGTGLTSYFPFMQALGMLWGISVEPNVVVVSPQTRIRLASLPTGISGDLQILPMPAELARLTC